LVEDGFVNVDFHLHTTESDGKLSPVELMRAVAAAGLDRFSVTDHDTFAVYERHAEFFAPLSSRMVTGVEVSTNTGEREVHILGYGVRCDAPSMQDILCDRTAVRRGRAERIVELLRSAGVSISMDDVRRQAGNGMIGRPHIARALVQVGAARDISDAFDRYIGVGCVAFLPSSTIRPAQAIRAINESGGVSVLAHPTRNQAEELLEELVRAGLMGIEAYSPSHTPHDAERFRMRARDLGLVLTAGTDFHAPTEANPKPGVDVPADELASFLERLDIVRDSSA
jgi:predicted metal-dependent phosphoesterase TrpH